MLINNLTLICDLNILKDNLSKIKDSLKSGTRLLFMLKANAYGHGIVEVANASEKLVDFFGVANTEEGIILREAGITKPILVTVLSYRDINDIINYDLTPVISNEKHLIEINSICFKLGITKKVHIKVDTGMNRLGFKDKSIFDKLKDLKNIEVEGFCSHLYSGNTIDVFNQNKIFKEFCVNTNCMHHICSSNSIKFEEFNYEMVRVGISGYGYSKDLDVMPCMKVLSSIVEYKTIASGEVVGYDAVFKADKKTNIAVIRGGYFDGITRKMVGQNVIFKNRLCPIIAVCMDMSIINIFDLEAEEGEEVILIGSNDKLKIDAQDIANHCDTISYEILTNYKGRISRVYYN